MQQLIPMFSLLLGFTVVMAGVSMMVSMIVGVVHKLAATRSRNLAEMLALVNQAFRSHHGDYASADDAASAAFVGDVLSDVVLKSGSDAKRAPDRRARRPIEYIARKDLIEIIAKHSPGGVLPKSWHTALPPEQATAKEFALWLDKWFATIEANATDRFRKESGRVVAVVSTLAVVLLNLDAIQLAFDLFEQSALTSALAQHADGLDQLAEDSNADPLAPPSADPLGDFVQINSMLNVHELKLGWQRSTFIDRYCTWRGSCNLPTSLTKETNGSDFVHFWLIYFPRWLVGLFAASMLLWLGAPFWADRLHDLLRLRSGVEQMTKRKQANAAAQT